MPARGARACAACAALAGRRRCSAAPGARAPTTPISPPSARRRYPLSCSSRGTRCSPRKPDAAADPQDAPAGRGTALAAPALRRRRGARRLPAARAVEAEGETRPEPFTPLAGGRLPFGGARADHRDVRRLGARRARFRDRRRIAARPVLALAPVRRGRAAPARAAAVRRRVPARLSRGRRRRRRSRRDRFPRRRHERRPGARRPAVRPRRARRRTPRSPSRWARWASSPGGARRPIPGTDWFRFAAGLSVLYGTVAAPRTLAQSIPISRPQWRVRGRHDGIPLLGPLPRRPAAVVPGSTAQGAALEPGVTLFGRRLDLVARGDWERAGTTNVWGAGAGLTAYGPDPRLRLNAGFERRWTRPSPPAPTAAPTGRSSGWRSSSIDWSIDPLAPCRRRLGVVPLLHRLGRDRFVLADGGGEAAGAAFL